MHQRVHCYNQNHAGCHNAFYNGIVCNVHLFTYNSRNLDTFIHLELF